jgi:hypothetical protein
MGIYSDGNIYGIAISLQVGSYFSELFNKIYPAVMTCEQIQEAKTMYDKLTEGEKSSLNIRFYTSCSSTYDLASAPFMSWFPGDLISLEKLFTEGSMRI